MKLWAGLTRGSWMALGFLLVLAGPAQPAEAKSKADKLYDEARKAEDEGNEALALRKDEEACRLGNSYSCNNAAADYAVGSGTAEDQPKALTLYVRACDLDDDQDDACEEAGDLLSRNEAGIKADPVRARVYYKRACDLSGGLGRGCAAFGKMARDGLGGAKDDMLARTYFMRACDGYQDAGCMDAFRMVFEGTGGPQDPVKSREFASRGCNGDDLDSSDRAKLCNAAGRMHGAGIGGAKDQKAALILYQRACGMRNAEGCYNLAFQYEGGEGVAKDMKQAARLYDQSCKLGLKEACAVFGK
jgi:TPR repeat protein